MALNRSALALTLAASACVGACSSSKNPAPGVPMAGERSEISTLAGRWEGTYSSESTGRSGSIVFELKPGDTVARGDVLMVPRQGDAAPKLPGVNESLRGMPQVLTIRFVSASGGNVQGTMDPYRDPDCDCEVQTTFVGRLSGDTVEGTFTTARSGIPMATGRWSIARQKK